MQHSLSHPTRVDESRTKTYGKTKASYGCPTCIILEECHQFVPPKVLANRHQELLRALFSMSTKEYRKYGSGHVFIDQSLGAISEDLQIQTFLLGATTSPADLCFLESQLGREVALAAQRTIGGTETPSWVAYGVATPTNGIPWEIETFKPEELSIFSNEQLWLLLIGHPDGPTRCPLFSQLLPYSAGTSPTRPRIDSRGSALLSSEILRR